MASFSTIGSIILSFAIVAFVYFLFWISVLPFMLIEEGNCRQIQNSVQLKAPISHSSNKFNKKRISITSVVQICLSMNIYFQSASANNYVIM